MTFLLFETDTEPARRFFAPGVAIPHYARWLSSTVHCQLIHRLAPFPPSLRRPTAIDQNIGAGDEAGLLGAQINGKLPNLFRLAPAVGRDLRKKLRAQFGILHQR